MGKKRSAADGKTTAIAATPPPLDRVLEVFGWLISGASEAQVRATIAASWPEADPAPLIVAAVDRLIESGQFDPIPVQGWCFEAARMLFARMVESGENIEALRAVKLVLDMARAQPLPPEAPQQNVSTIGDAVSQ